MNGQEIRVGQVWRRIKGVKPGTLVRVDYVEEAGVGWRRVLAPHTRGALFTATWRRLYEFVEDAR